MPKALILDAVREGPGRAWPNASPRTHRQEHIAGSKKEAMVADAAALLDGKGWLPTMLRVPGATYSADSGDAQAAETMPTAAE